MPAPTSRSLNPLTSPPGPLWRRAPPRALSRPPRPPGGSLTGVHLCPRCTTVTHCRQWAPHLPVPQIETPPSWASSLAAHRCTSSPVAARIGRRATALLKLGKIPCFGCGPKCRDQLGLFKPDGPSRCRCSPFVQCHFIISIRIYSIQIQNLV
jgi:hypothetical protein